MGRPGQRAGTHVHATGTPVADAEFLHRTLPHAQLLALEAAHISNVEQADAFTDALRVFFGS